MPPGNRQTVVPQAAPGLRFERFALQLSQAISTTLQDGVFVGGAAVVNFEAELARYLGVEHVIGCNSGTDALFLSLMAIGIGPGDEVIVPALTAAATAVAVIRTGASPRFADVSAETRNIDAEAIMNAMTASVRAIIVVHLHGRSADIGPILEFGDAHSIPIIEDCAQAIGATNGDQFVGTFGCLGAFSFYPTKNLGCLGDGGAVATNDPDIAARIRTARNYGWNDDRLTTSFGINSRLDAIQANVLSALLPELDAANAERRHAAQIYDAAFQGLDLNLPQSVFGSVYHQYALDLENPEQLGAYLLNAGYGTAAHYRLGLHEEPYFKRITGRSAHFPATEYLCKRLLSLPIQPELMDHQVGVIDAVKDYFSS